MLLLSPSTPPVRQSQQGLGLFQGDGEHWAVGTIWSRLEAAAWNCHTHMTPTCSENVIHWSGTMAWQTPGVWGKSPLCQGKRDNCTFRAPRRAPQRGAIGILLLPVGSAGYQIVVSSPSNRHIHMGEVWNCQRVPLKDIGRANTTTEQKIKVMERGHCRTILNVFLIRFCCIDLCMTYCPCNWTSNRCWQYFSLDCENVNRTYNKSCP